jgi:hypothetical protein
MNPIRHANEKNENIEKITKKKTVLKFQITETLYLNTNFF